MDTWLNSFYSDGSTYYPSLFDENYLPKKAFTALINLGKWSCRANGNADCGTNGNSNCDLTATPTATPTVDPDATPTPTPIYHTDSGDPTAEPEPAETKELDLAEAKIL